MEKKEITITVSGKSNTGKSRIMFLIKEALKSKGLEINIETDDFKSDLEFDKKVSKNINDVINKIKNNTTINLVENRE